VWSYPHRLRIILLHVLSAFHPSSRANLYHACGVLKESLRALPDKTVAALGSSEASILLKYVGLLSLFVCSVPTVMLNSCPSLMRQAFQNVHESPVAECLLDLIAAPTSEETKTELWQRVIGDYGAIMVRRTCHRPTLGICVVLFPNTLFPWCAAVQVLTDDLCRLDTDELSHSHACTFLVSLCEKTTLQSQAQLLIRALADPASTMVTADHAAHSTVSSGPGAVAASPATTDAAGAGATPISRLIDVIRDERGMW